MEKRMRRKKEMTFLCGSVFYKAEFRISRDALFDQECGQMV